MSDLNDYNVRISAATDQLEADVANISGFADNLSDAVTQAEQSAQQAQTEVQEILDLKPVFKGEYGKVEEYATRIVINTEQQVEDLYGAVFKAKVGCTGISLDALPTELLQGFHVYVRNETSVSISVTSSVGSVDVPVIASGAFVRIVFNSTRDGFEVINYSNEGSESPVRFESVIESSSSTDQVCTTTNMPTVIQLGAASGTVGDPISFDGDGTFTANVAGQYLVYASANIGRSSGSGTGEVKIGFLINGTSTSNPRYVKLQSGNNVVPFSATLPISVSSGDTIQAYIEDVGGTHDIGVFSSNGSPSANVQFSRITGAVISGSGGGDFDWTTIPEATDELKGLMSAEDKTKLDGVESYNTATQEADGLMSAEDKTKLDDVEANAQVNVNADFNATSGKALILNKPSTVDLTYSYNPVTGENEITGGTDGYMAWEDKRDLEELKESSGSGGIEEAPEDGKQYARKDATWTEVVSSGGGGSSSIDLQDLLLAGGTPSYNPVTGKTVHSRKIEIKTSTDWNNIVKDPAWLLDKVFGTSDLAQMDYTYREIPVYITNNYSGMSDQIKAPFAANSHNWMLVKVSPYMYRDTDSTVYSSEGSNAVIEITYISNSFTDLRTEGSAGTPQTGTNAVEPRKYINFTQGSNSSGSTGTSNKCYYAFPWREMTYTTPAVIW